MPRAPQISPQKLIRILKKLDFIEHAERGTSHWFSRIQMDVELLSLDIEVLSRKARLVVSCAI